MKKRIVNAGDVFVGMNNSGSQLLARVRYSMSYASNDVRCWILTFGGKTL